MSKVKLKKIISKKEVINIIEVLIDDLGISVSIEDKSGIIYETDKKPESEEKYDIKVQDDIIGWIKGDKKVLSLVSVITNLANAEAEKHKLAEETLEKYREINMLYDISEKMATTVGVDNVAKLVVYEAMRYLDSTDVSIMLLNENDNRLILTSEIYKNENMKMPAKPDEPKIGAEDYVVKNVISSGKAEIVNGTYDNPNLKSIICVPIFIKNKIIGVIAAGNKEEATYDSSDLKLFTTLSFQAGSAIENARLYDALKDNIFKTVQTLAELLDKRDTNLTGHAKRVGNYSLGVAKTLKLPKIELIKIKLASLFHDIGNLGIKDDELTKKNMTEDEKNEIVRKHTILGYEILKNIEQLRDIVPLIRSHHEKFDGTGLPDGLKGDNIPFISRIIAVSEYFDEITAVNEDRDEFSMYFAVEQLRNNSGTHYDPKIVDAFLQTYKGKKLEEMQREGNYV